MSLVGSVPTPYIFDDRVDFRDVAKTIEDLYNLSPEERQRRGQLGKDWVMSDESRMTSHNMCFTIVEAIGPNAKAVVAGLLPWNGSTWFFKLTGSSDAVEKQKVSFLQFLKTVKTP
jgi:hypothetical protein